MTTHHIVVATDLSPEGTRCWLPVVDLARTLGARITLLHVLEGYEAIPHGAPLAPPLEEPGATEDLEGARAALEAQRASIGQGVDVRTEVLAGGDAAKEIADWAEQNGADLIALSTHGRTGFRHFVFGSVAEAVVRRSRVPVLVFPHPSG